MTTNNRNRSFVSRTNRFVFLVTFAAIMSIIMAACTGTSEPPETTPTFPVSTATQPPQATAEPTQEAEESPTSEVTPIAEPTQEPMESPTPEATAEPTQEPVETPTVEPTQEPMETPTPDATPDIPSPPQVPTATFDIVAPWPGAEVETDFVTVWVALDYEEEDGMPTVTINGESAIMMDDTAAYLNVSLMEGENIINVTSVDSTGAVVSDDITVTYTPPVEGTLPLAIFYPRDGLTVLDEQIMVIGGTSTDAQVTVNGDPAMVDADGMFLANVDLIESDYVLEVVASGTNGEGQQITTALSLMLEEFVPEETPEPTMTPEPEETPEPTATPEPEEPALTTLNVLSPGADAEVETPVITVLLQLLDSVIVRVNGELVEVPEDGYIQTDVMLTEGDNVIEINASNFSSGISESASFTVTYEPPSDFDDLPLSIYYPSDELVVSDPELRVVGGTVANTQVAVDGDIAEVSDSGTFSAILNLAMGENEIEIYAVDDAFDSRERTETIVVIYEP